MNRRKKIVIISIFLVALGIRLLLAPFTGHQTDINCFKGWALMASEGLTAFYTGNGFIDYPPGYIYILYLIGGLVKLFNIGYDSMFFTLIIKLPAIIADLIIGIYLYKLMVNQFNDKEKMLIMIFYLFNPAIIINSSVWGQIDSVFTLVLVATIGYLYKNNLKKASLCFALAILIKPQALMFAPLFLFKAFDFIMIEKKYKELIQSLVIGLLVLVILCIPFMIKAGPLLIIEKYRTTLESYPYASLNAFNLHTLFKGNWVADTDKMLGISHRLIGQISIVLTVILSGYYYFRNRVRQPHDLYYIASFIVCFVYTMVHKMHERYLFPMLIFLLVLYIYTKREQFKWLYIGFSAIHFINVAFVLWLYENGNPLYRDEPIVIILSLLQIIGLLCFMLYPKNTRSKEISY